MSNTYLLTPWCRVLFEKLTGLQLVKKFPAFHGTRRFITALTSVRRLSLSWASPIQSIYPHPTPWRSVLILFTHLRLGLPSGLLPSSFPTKTLYTPLSSPIRATCPAHLILLNFITLLTRRLHKRASGLHCPFFPTAAELCSPCRRIWDSFCLSFFFFSCIFSGNFVDVFPSTQCEKDGSQDISRIQGCNSYC